MQRSTRNTCRMLGGVVPTIPQHLDQPTHQARFGPKVQWTCNSKGGTTCPMLQQSHNHGIPSVGTSPMTQPYQASPQQTSPLTHTHRRLLHATCPGNKHRAASALASALSLRCPNDGASAKLACGARLAHAVSPRGPRAKSLRRPSALLCDPLPGPAATRSPTAATSRPIGRTKNARPRPSRGPWRAPACVHRTSGRARRRELSKESASVQKTMRPNASAPEELRTKPRRHAVLYRFPLRGPVIEHGEGQA